MPKVKKGKAIPPPMSKNATRVLNLIMAIGFISAIPQILTTFMTSWREGEPIEYKYMFRGSEHSLYVDYTYYGLYKVIYDDRHVETWTQRVQNMRNKGSESIQVGRNSEASGSLSLWTSACQEPCRNSIIKRIEAYERVSFISLVLLCGIVLACSLIVMSVGWNILFTKNILISMGCFMLSFIINGGIGTYWYYETDLSWNLVTKSQQFPFPKCSYSFYIFMITTCIYGLCFIGLLLLDLSNKNSQKKSYLNHGNNRNMMFEEGKGMAYQPLYDQNNMMMPRSASYSNMMHFGKGIDNYSPNFIPYNNNKMSMNNPMGMNMMGSNVGGYPGFRNMPSGMGNTNMMMSNQNMNPMFLPQMSRQFSYSSSPSMGNFGMMNFQNRNIQDMRNIPNQRGYSRMSFDINNPYGSQKQHMF
ncbi:claudin-like apicomplexan microneme protein, putative [Plasmodium yoelii]|uniref:Claudin-like apicomplexan microneme protein n=3 Tax=Plasmodium yoelii TaxID=5861 RepID=A0AAE9WNR7_PLAYO|nr:claudin-like apicomplexan microneme protein, putative [Plasmodium yoelii]EAA16450.1 hypothetical protein [Plasmodium yoelii yoelii]WBY55674.1 claudin-like apicomplexan microneme protein [Plasmodium yoelii yoelii]CDU16741.1 conserved Plasmodium protein, unknown function [Plasmodium yoelii]VTZ74308.1 claudin-like apicomplexan microneme protein, putative [Plasmodium yoelii]|eukprot:XP_724885.1 claudin-like apicomplexan microneme protein, putative [Plasmodium yoelii]